MTKKKKLMAVLVLTVLAILAIFAVSTLLMSVISGKFFASSSAPAMPEVKEVKSEPPFKSPVLDKAWKLQDEDRLLQILIGAYDKEGFKISISVFADNAVATVFLKELLEDKDSLRIFHYFGAAGVRIFLSDKYIIGSGYVHINARDGVKKTVKWLTKGEN